MKTYIIGAGLSGLIAGNMLRAMNPVIMEKADELPNNHHAILRFRSNAAALATGIPFKKVDVNKGIWIDDTLYSMASLADNNRYSQKVTGKVLNRSVLNLDTTERYIAPPNFIEQLGNSANVIKLGESFSYRSYKTRMRAYGHPVISTLPMPFMMKEFSYEGHDPSIFDYESVYVTQWEIISPKTDVYQTIYFPDHQYPFYRASITGNQLIIESRNTLGEHASTKVAEFLRKTFGIRCLASELKPITQDKHMPYGKITPIDEGVRKDFIRWLTVNYGIYSLGRFATWRQLLLDDVVQDVNVIQHAIVFGNYDLGKI